MGEAKRRKNQDPTFGTKKRQPRTNDFSKYANLPTIRVYECLEKYKENNTYKLNDVTMFDAAISYGITPWIVDETNLAEFMAKLAANEQVLGTTVYAQTLKPLEIGKKYRGVVLDYNPGIFSSNFPRFRIIEELD